MILNNNKEMLNNKSIRHIHFIGIGGSGMNPLASILAKMEYNVSGSDIKENVYILRLKEMGVQIFHGHDASNVRLAHLIVISSAIRKNNIELEAAKKIGIPIIKRAELLSFIMDKHRHKIAVSGTHGKTTVSSFLAHNLNSSGQNPTFIIGATLKESNIAGQLGNRGIIIAEADESDRSFLFLNPNILVITNIEEEHVDQFKNLQDIMKTFENFIKRVPKNGIIILSGDDTNTKNLDLKGRKAMTYGFDKKNIVRAINIRQHNGKMHYDVTINEKLVSSEVMLNIPGKHNITNSLVVYAISYHLQLDLDIIPGIFKEFQGASRRFHEIGKESNIIVYDDYAHHPTEIKVTLKAAKEYKRPITAIFQPHRFSRFTAFKHQFAKALDIADKIVITEIYSAGEKNKNNISAKELIPFFKNNKATYISHVGSIGRAIAKTAKKNDLIITLGAGDVTLVGKEILQLLKQKNKSNVDLTNTNIEQSGDIKCKKKN